MADPLGKNMNQVLRILDKEKFLYVIETCKFYGIPYEITEEGKNDNISTGSESDPGKAKGKPVLGLSRSN